MTRAGLALILVLCAWYPAAGQATATTGQIEGTSPMSQGGALPGVTVSGQERRDRPRANCGHRGRASTG